jgi:hypothetical protein
MRSNIRSDLIILWVMFLSVPVAGPVLNVHFMAVVDDSVDCRDFVEVELHIFLGLLAEVQLIPVSQGTIRFGNNDFDLGVVCLLQDWQLWIRLWSAFF